MQRKTICRENEKDGSLEFVDEQTGEVVAVQKQSKTNERLIAEGKKPLARRAAIHYKWKKNKNGIPILVPNTFPQKEVDKLPDDYVYFRNDEELLLNICLLISNGYSLSRVGEVEGMPPRSVVFNWYYKDPIFRGMVDEARKIRAEFYHDQVHDIAEKVKERNAKSSKVKLEAYKHLMAVNDRERFGQQTKVVGDPSKPISFVIDTGIHSLPMQEGKETIDVTPKPECEPVSGEGDSGAEQRVLDMDSSNESGGVWSPESEGQD